MADIAPVILGDPEIAENVEIGPFTIVHGNVRIEEGTRIESHCVIGYPSGHSESPTLVIGRDSLVRSHSVLYGGSTFGPQLETGHHVTIRERTTAGANLRVGSYSDLQGDLQIGNYVRLHSSVFIGKGSVLDDFVWIFPFTVLTNDPTPPSDAPDFVGTTVEKFAVLGAMTCVAPGLRIAKNAVVAAGSMVTKDVQQGMLVIGHPAKPIGPASAIKLRHDVTRAAYPWITHFHRGYPDAIVKGWLEDLGE